MGLTKESRNVTFLSISKGEMVKRVAEPTADSRTRVLEKGPNAGKTVHEETGDTITGLITGISYEEKDVNFGSGKLETITVIIEDDGDIYHLEWKLSSTYSKSLITRLEAIDFSKEVKLKTHWIEGDDNKFRGFMSIWQGGVKIEPLYEKTDMPATEAITNKKGEVIAYDDDELMKFYKSIIDAAVTKLKPSQSANNSVKPEIEEQEEEEESQPEQKERKIF